LTAYLNDGVDYMGLQTASLRKAQLMGNLRRDVEDSIAALGSGDFAAQSTAIKQARLLKWAASITTHTQEVQNAIDLDYANFLDVEKKVEALDLAYSLTSGWSDPNIKNTLSSTLNTSVKTILGS